jgi:predicted enzyme related to lactoylglutathione lyase
MNTTPTLRGFATISLYAADHAAATKWYAELLGRPPYFDKPGYAEFRFGDYQHELGLIDSRYATHDVSPSRGPAGVVVYWYVDDVAATLARLVAMGATLLEGPVERGTGFVTASVVDPFGNILGVMYNAHYLDVLRGMTAAAGEPVRS